MDDEGLTLDRDVMDTPITDLKTDVYREYLLRELSTTLPNITWSDLTLNTLHLFRETYDREYAVLMEGLLDGEDADTIHNNALVTAVFAVHLRLKEIDDLRRML